MGGDLRAGTRRVATPGLMVLAVLAVSAGGCAERKLATRPESAPSTATWLVVAIAAVLCAAVLGVLLTLPVWRARSGSRLAVAVLTAHVGAVVVGGAVLAGVAIRTWQLFDRPVESAAQPALLRLSTVDGDTGFYALMLLVTVVLSALSAFLLALSARWAGGEARVGRYIAWAVLMLLLLVDAAGAVMLVLGSSAWPYVVLALSSPVTAAALVSCWPRRHRAAIV